MKILSIFIRKKREWFYVVVEYRDNLTNKKKQKSLGKYSTERQANKALVIEKSKYYQSDFIIPSKTTLESYLSDWHTSRYKTLAITTYNRYGLIIKHITNNIGCIELQKITPSIIQNFINDLTLSDKTKLQYYRVFNKAFGDAYKLQIISKNPCSFIDAPKPRKKPIQYLNLEQSIKLLEYIKGTSFEIAVNLALVLGLRASEVCGLRWSRINFNTNTIVIDTAVVYDEVNKIKIVKDTKNDSSYRILVAPGGLIELLKEHKEKQKDMIGSGDNFIYLTLNGEPQSSRSFCSNFKRWITKKEDLPPVSFHGLRHTNASLLLNEKVDVKVISGRLGHSSIGITLDTYTHVMNSLEVDAANKLDTSLYAKNNKNDLVSH